MPHMRATASGSRNLHVSVVVETGPLFVWPTESCSCKSVAVSVGPRCQDDDDFTVRVRLIVATQGTTE